MISLLLRYRVLVISWVIVTYSRVSTRGLQRMQLASGPEVQSEGSFEREIRSERREFGTDLRTPIARQV